MTNLSNLAKYLEDIYDSNKGKQIQISPNIIGEGGIGKTDSIFQLAQRKGARVFTLSPAEFMDTADLLGIPHEVYLTEEGWCRRENIKGQVKRDVEGYEIVQTHYARPVWWSVDDLPTILLIDDSFRGNSSLQQALMNLVHKRTFNGKTLPVNTQIFLTNNPSGGEYNVTEIDSAQEGRMLNYYVDFNLEDWLNWASLNGIREDIMLFVSEFPEMMSCTTTDQKVSNNRNSPRAVTMLSNVLGNRQITEKNTSYIQGLGSGCFKQESMFLSSFLSFVNQGLVELPTMKFLFTEDEKTVRSKFNELGKHKASVGIFAILARRIVNEFVNFSAERMDKTMDRAMWYLNSDVFSLDKRIIIWSGLKKDKNFTTKFLQHPGLIQFSESMGQKDIF